MHGLAVRVREACPARAPVPCCGLALALGAGCPRAALRAVALTPVAGTADEYGRAATGAEKASGCDGHRLANADGRRENLERERHTERGCAKARLPGTTSPPWPLTRRGVVPDLHRPRGVYGRREDDALDAVTTPSRRTAAAIRAHSGYISSAANERGFWPALTPSLWQASSTRSGRLHREPLVWRQQYGRASGERKTAQNDRLRIDYRSRLAAIQIP